MSASASTTPAAAAVPGADSLMKELLQHLRVLDDGSSSSSSSSSSGSGSGSGNSSSDEAEDENGHERRATAAAADHASFLARLVALPLPRDVARDGSRTTATTTQPGIAPADVEYLAQAAKFDALRALALTQREGKSASAAASASASSTSTTTTTTTTTAGKLSATRELPRIPALWEKHCITAFSSSARGSECDGGLLVFRVDTAFASEPGRTPEQVLEHRRRIFTSFWDDHTKFMEAIKPVALATQMTPLWTQRSTPAENVVVTASRVLETSVIEGKQVECDWVVVSQTSKEKMALSTLWSTGIEDLGRGLVATPPWLDVAASLVDADDAAAGGEADGSNKRARGRGPSRPALRSGVVDVYVAVRTISRHISDKPTTDASRIAGQMSEGLFMYVEPPSDDSDGGVLRAVYCHTATRGKVNFAGLPLTDVLGPTKTRVSERLAALVSQYTARLNAAYIGSLSLGLGGMGGNAP